MSDATYSRRQAFGNLAAMLLPGIESPPRRAPLDELVLVEEFQDNAKLVLPAEPFSAIAGGERRAFERITFRPRVMRPTLDMDLSVALFGVKHFSPILVGAVPDQKRFHPDGELATARGAAAAQAGLVLSSQASLPLEQVAAVARTPLWFDAGNGPVSGEVIRRAVQAGCQVVCLPLGADLREARAAWATVVVRGVADPAEARRALAEGAQGIMVETRYGLAAAPPGDAAGGILALPDIVDAVAGRAPVILDSHFELGVDILKALASGATAVLVSRPAMWGLAAYGADGVEVVVEMLQAELARGMAMCGAADLGTLSRRLLRLHP